MTIFRAFDHRAFLQNNTIKTSPKMLTKTCPCIKLEVKLEEHVFVYILLFRCRISRVFHSHPVCWFKLPTTAYCNILHFILALCYCIQPHSFNSAVVPFCKSVLHRFKLRWLTVPDFKYHICGGKYSKSRKFVNIFLKFYSSFVFALR